MEPGVTLIERFSHPNFLRGREDLIGNIFRKTAAATKRVKTEEVDPVPLLQTASSPRQEGDMCLTVSHLRDSVCRLESQNASLLAQAAQQQEVLNHLIHILARHNLLSETELPRQIPLAVISRGDRMFASDKTSLASPQSAESPPDLMMGDEDDYEGMFTALDMPSAHAMDGSHVPC